MLSNFNIPFEYLFKECNQPKTSKNLILLLHGYGSNKEDLFSMADDLNSLGHVLSIQAPISLHWGGYAWFNLDFLESGVRESDQDEVEDIILKLRETINKLSKDLSDIDSITLMGFSQGAILSLELIQSNLDKVDNLVAMSGYYGGYMAINTSDVAVLQTHGDIDHVIPVQRARDSRDLLQDKISDYTYKEYRMMSHGISPECFSDIINWLSTRLDV